ncbi:GNAT family N-acetyltransferase [Candidatus Bathyarchaeota archaeon]|nr:MAG: GNAT family N-acetyltransferase [Candidatus Bathyarchaeota archaeon]
MIVKYDSSRKEEWNDFVMGSKNGAFFFLRDYVEYHSHRFEDHSLMFYEDDELRAVLPANIDGLVLYSHEGLSFGGMVLDFKITATKAVSLFSELLMYAKWKEISKIRYKCIPYIYHIQPAQEDLYSLYQADSMLLSRKPSSVIKMRGRIDFQTLRKRAIKKGIKNELVVIEVDDYKTYWDMLVENLIGKYSVKPAHSLEEIEYLRDKFPNNIRLFASFKNKVMMAGVVMYENRTVVRAQYIATTPEGRDMGALDIIIAYLINTRYANKDYFDFGVSTETYLVNGKLVLNQNLLFQKEGFGSRSVMYDTYEARII